MLVVGQSRMKNVVLEGVRMMVESIDKMQDSK